ncbi:putative membrane spanning protein [Granulibacter bethesdensis]|uniref:Membrane spanning protein n=2 Tax=Granulibacter bethesdensis TaxID=364410 RepID=A0AAN0VGG8_9PROT|nr:putative membrane spanning protein [Granulibacter bethesdensis]AHJ65903.1 putative membrane spanning protein [Granulibacter bethesdensis CGDNIH4]
MKDCRPEARCGNIAARSERQLSARQHNRGIRMSHTTHPVPPGPYGDTGWSSQDEYLALDERRIRLSNRISWGAVLAGVVLALVVQALLNLLGIGIGLSSVDAANSSGNPDADTLSMAAAGWWTLSGIIAAFFGGHVAGRLSGTAKLNTARWHGLVSWAATTFVLFYILTTAVGGMVGGAISTVGSGVGHAIGGTASGIGSMVGGIGNAAGTAAARNPDDAKQAYNSLEAQVRSLVNPSDAQAVQNSAVAYVKAKLNGNQQEADRAREQAVNGLAKAANISPDEAKTRLDALEQQYQKTVDEAKQQAIAAAEATRKAAARGAIFGVIGLLLGAVAAWFGGGAGAPEAEAVIHHNHVVRRD